MKPISFFIEETERKCYKHSGRDHKEIKNVIFRCWCCNSSSKAEEWFDTGKCPREFCEGRTYPDAMIEKYEDIEQL
ncbi:hypothetical protein GJ688_18350 [Heliobacillus mobilis]|uniref:Uncharacterized protein n=1 Tax=Heliobacterium mobile TaxID=28064 RepID=A0A6I3SQB3_HELMO|nr:hypothetical protein [Heliobacterium mobile]MTV50885.1 hypothetical protein [Heliobacterium mobile]